MSDADAGSSGLDPTAPVEPAHGMPTEAKVFLALGVFALVIDAIYIVGSIPGGIEAAGAVSLAAAAVFSFFLGYYLDHSVRKVQADVEAREEKVASGELDHDSPEALYLPETSIWPLGIGAGSALTFVGLAFGWWFMIPGVALLVHSVIGFAHQSRDRRLD